MDGCKKLTEKSVYHVVNFCANIQHISMVACDVGSLAVPDSSPKCTIDVLGCPLISPSAINILEISGSEKSKKESFQAKCMKGLFEKDMT